MVFVYPTTIIESDTDTDLDTDTVTDIGNKVRYSYKRQNTRAIRNCMRFRFKGL